MKGFDESLGDESFDESLGFDESSYCDPKSIKIFLLKLSIL